MDSEILASYKELYEKDDMSLYVSKKELSGLTKDLFFLQKSEDFLILHERKGREERRLKTHKFKSPSSWIFVPGAPKYHIDDKCESITNHFNNFHMPDEIQNQGEIAIIEFRKFAQDNKKLIFEGREDVFLERLKIKFNLKQPIGSVSHENSGSVVEITDEFTTLEELEIEIKKSIRNIEEIRSTEEGKKSIAAYLYARPDVNLKYHRNLSAIDKNLLLNKSRLLDCIRKYNIYKYKNGHIEYSKGFLEFYGFEPCGKCCSR